MAVLSVNVSDSDKEEFSKICDEMGMNISAAVNIFVKAVLRNGCIPFEVTSKKIELSKIESNKKNEVTYSRKHSSRNYEELEVAEKTEKYGK